MFKIAICEDQILEQNRIKRLIEKFCIHRFTVEIVVYGTGKELLEDLDRNFDIIFMDIQMPGMNGLKVSKEIRSKGSEVMIVFLTGLEEFASQGYEVQAFRFLLKPIEKEEFDDNMEKMIAHLQKNKKKVIIKTNQITHFVEINKIFYLEKDDYKVRFITEDGDYYSVESMKYWSEFLKDKDFVHCHGSVLINQNHVASYDRRQVVMDTGAVLKMSQQRYIAFHHSMMSFGGSY